MPSWLLIEPKVKLSLLSSWSVCVTTYKLIFLECAFIFAIIFKLLVFFLESAKAEMKFLFFGTYFAGG